ncbi:MULTISPECIES: bacillithiol biosynthesis deacetylase BshB2 [unclassified Bacillus (in: firmicutes)]|uniref:bacillithiol biosynthesis deacetylase BshB2 n=1 Tax=unclassified Bacillus (in: firmicutes) TaxID=185979 RepID=UPI000BF1E726|nr:MULTISPECIES: bacillithiol biosynthesis deacetylase BshB2 [unclassified Bacillus (in: firmicutes)]PEJ53642.1 bacillithiol biosynthesis deacetylase BshB2 [Bacillus sp. AFS002410]PEL11144.1 bacillithiol biosynthesis deacetylase BshB2 [Bacillus sp. AFS017336]
MSQKEEKVLLVFPHPDDEAFGAAGTISKFTNKGIPVTYACLTLGEMGRNMGNPFFATRESLPTIRKNELIDACREMGIQDLRMLGFHDKTIEFEDPEAVIEPIKEIIDEIQPTLLITFYPDHGVHPDHDATARAAVEAVRRMDKDDRPTVWCIAITKERFEVLGKPDIVNDVMDVATQKLRTMKAHRSQTESMLKDVVKIEKFEDIPDDRLKSFFAKESFYTYQFE